MDINSILDLLGYCLFFPIVFDFSFEYMPFCSASSENAYCSFKRFHKTFVEFTNLKAVWCSQKSDFQYWVCSPAAIKNSKELIWDHKVFLKKTPDTNKAVFCFSNPTDYACLVLLGFFKFRKTRLDEDRCRAQSCATTVLWTLHCLKRVFPLIFIFIGSMCTSWLKVYQTW